MVSALQRKNQSTEKQRSNNLLISGAQFEVASARYSGLSVLSTDSSHAFLCFLPTPCFVHCPLPTSASWAL